MPKKNHPSCKDKLSATEQELHKVNHELQERVKELECLYGLSRLDEQPDIILEEIFQGLVELIPASWEYPEITAARIRFEDRHYKTSNFRKTTWLQSADIKVHNRKSGTIEVCYLRKMPTIDEGPFLIEERNLLDALAKRLGHIAERIEAEEAVEAANQQLKADEQQLRAANQQLQAEVTERKKAEEIVRREKEKAEQYLNIAGVMLVTADVDENITLINKKVCEILGYNKEELIGKNWFDLLVPREIRKEVRGVFGKLIAGDIEPVEYYENPLLTKNGEQRLISFHNTVIKGSSGQITGVLFSGSDITERKRAEEALKAANQQLRADEQQIKAANQQLQANEQQFKAANQQLKANEQQLEAANEQLRASEQQLRAANQQLQASEQQLRAANQQLLAEVNERKKEHKKVIAALKEKEVLLKEVHHRVKNNMQVISSILNLQSKYVDNGKALEIFKNGQGRIKSMALVHEKLYESEDLANIDFAEYVHSITHYLFGLHEISPRIRLNLDIEDVSMDVSTAIPCGLIINELLSNSLKYAFPEDIEGEICIQLFLDKDDKLTLIVKDNGVGFPKDIDFRRTESLGMQLIIMLAEQLEGIVELDKSKGTAFTIKFETQILGETKKWQV